MNDITKTLAGVVIGASLVISGDALSADSVVTVSPDGKVVITEDKTVTIFSGTLKEVEDKIASLDRHIGRVQKEIDTLNAQKSVYVALKVKIENEINK